MYTQRSSCRLFFPGRGYAMIKFCVIVILAVLTCSAELFGQSAPADSVLPASLQKSVVRMSGGGGGDILVFLLNFSDFGCELCLDDFLDLCDSLRAAGVEKRKGSVVMCFLRDKNPISYQSTTLQKWARASGIPFPMTLEEEGEYSAVWFRHSRAYLIGNNGHIELSCDIPTPPPMKRLIVDRVSRSGGR